MINVLYSERADATSNFDKNRLKEGSLINKSLTTLGNVIQALGKLHFGYPKCHICLTVGVLVFQLLLFCGVA